MRSWIVFVVTALLAACDSSGSPDVGGTAPAGQPSGSASAEQPPSSNAPSSEAGARAVGEAAVAVTNSTGGPLTIYINQSGQFPLWLEIGSPNLPIGVVGLSFCETNNDHNDPSPAARTLEAGAIVTFTWDGSYWEIDQGCWRQRTASPGAYPSKACAYGPAGPNGDAGAPRCVSFDVDLPASGKAAAAASW